MSAPDSFEEYVAARYPALVRTAYLLTGNHHDAEDLVQSALVKSVPKWRRIEDDPTPYIRRILLNEHISRWRRHRGREVVVEQTPDEAVHADTTETVALAQALRQLAPRQRAVVVLRYYEGLTEAQAADVLGVSVGTVKSQHSDAVRRLRGLLSEPVAVAPVRR